MPKKKSNSKSITYRGKKLYGAAAKKVEEMRKARAKSNPKKKSNKAAGIAKSNSGRSRKAKNSKPVMSHGHRVFGAAAKAVLKKRQQKNGKTKHAKKRNLDHRDAQHPIHVTQYWQGRRGYETEWQRAHKAGQRQLFSMNGKKKKKSNARSTIGAGGYARAAGRIAGSLIPLGFNPSAIDDFIEFQGRQPNEVVDMLVPDGTPNNTAVVGPIPEIELENGDKLFFHESQGEPPTLLRRGNRLYIAPGDFRWSMPNVEIGRVKKIHYIAHKDHINGGETIQYHHRFGEEGGESPTLCSDNDSCFRLKGGSYTIASEGIRD